MAKPNLFEIGTKELSQDAFITWLLKWADKDCQQFDKDLHECGKAFVNTLIKKQYPDFSEEITKVEAGRQWESIDIWAEVNDQYLIIIEDKTHSGQHSKQLERYKEIAEKWCKDNNKQEPICIYLKTGNESIASLNTIKNKGYHLFGRVDFIGLFASFENVNNDILKDFCDRMLQIEEWTQNFNYKKVSDWKWYEWQGFYMAIENRVENRGWYYVDNMNGGFLNFQLNWDLAKGYPLYIQLEEKKLCFKISTNSDDIMLPEDKTRGQIRNEFYHLLIEKAKEKGYNEIRKPKKFADGTWMTFAIVEQEDWLGEDKVNVDKVVENLNKYLLFLREFIEEYNQKQE